jgi:hypothetical protein
VDGTFAADAQRGVAQPQPRSRSSARTAVQAVAGLILIASAAWLPWATYKGPGSRVTSHLNAGRLTEVLIALGALAIAIAAVYGIRPTRLGAASNVACGVAALITAVAAGATRIAHANSLTVDTGGTTRFGIGVGIGCLAAIAIAVSAAIETCPRPPDAPS